MVFHTSKGNVIYPKLKIHNNNIEMVTQFNILRIIGPTTFSYDVEQAHQPHSMKIAKSNAVLYRLRKIYPESVLVTVYNTL